MEVAKTRMAVAKQGQFDSIAACVRATVKHEGPPALYKGLAASLVGIVPFSAVDLALYSTLKERYAYYTYRTDNAHHTCYADSRSTPPERSGAYAAEAAASYPSFRCSVVARPQALWRR